MKYKVTIFFAFYQIVLNLARNYIILLFYVMLFVSFYWSLRFPLPFFLYPAWVCECVRLYWDEGGGGEGGGWGSRGVDGKNPRFLKSGQLHSFTDIHIQFTVPDKLTKCIFKSKRASCSTFYLPCWRHFLRVYMHSLVFVSNSFSFYKVIKFVFSLSVPRDLNKRR